MSLFSSVAKNSGFKKVAGFRMQYPWCRNKAQLALRSIGEAGRVAIRGQVVLELRSKKRYVIRSDVFRLLFQYQQ